MNHTEQKISFYETRANQRTLLGDHEGAAADRKRVEEYRTGSNK